MGKKKEVEKGKKITWVQNCMLAIYSEEFEEYKFHSKGASKFHIHLQFFGSVTGGKPCDSGTGGLSKGERTEKDGPPGAT